MEVLRGKSLPDTFFGYDTDEVFAYETNKKVWIRDRYLGLVYYILVGLILAYIIGFQILWENQHFVRKDVSGVQRMRAMHPTVDGCEAMNPNCQNNYEPLENLPYCKDYKVGAWDHASLCKYEDYVSADPEGTVDNKLFFPTAVEIVTEELVDGQYEEDPGQNCLKPGYLCQARGTQKDTFYYVADVGGFTVQFTSTYSRGEVQGSSLEEAGFYELCPARLREEGEVKKWSSRLYDKPDCSKSVVEENSIPCKPGLDCSRLQKFDFMKDTGESLKSQVRKIPGASKISLGRKGHQPQHFLGVSAERRASVESNDTKGGPPLSFLDVSAKRRVSAESNATEGHQPLHLLSVVSKRRASAASNATKERLKHRWHGNGITQNPWGDVFTIDSLLHLAGADLDNDYNIDGWTSRQAGTAIEVTVKYNNLYPFLSSFGYTPVKYTYEVRELPMPYVTRVHTAEVQPEDYPKRRRYEVRYGVLVWFKVGGTLGFFSGVYLLVMLTAAMGLISLATTLTDNLGKWLHPNFFHMKFDVSPDFSDMWTCEVCGYSNLEEDSHCQMVPAYACPRTTPKCNAPRPSEKDAEEAASEAPAEEPQETATPRGRGLLSRWRSSSS